MNISDLVNNSSVMKAGLRADTARAEIEYKNQLKNTGDIYVGTGESFENDGEMIYVTEGKNILAALNENFDRAGRVNIGTSEGAANSIAIGANAKAVDENGIALGNNASSALSGIALGNNASSGDASIALGNNVIIKNTDSGVVIGNEIQIASDQNTQIIDAVVIGNGSKIPSGWNSTGVVVIGSKANASQSSVAIGNTAKALADGVSMGNTSRTSSGVAIGNSASSSEGVSIGTGAKSELHAIAIGTNASTVKSLSGVAIGRLAKAETIDSVAIGNNATILSFSSDDRNSIAIGQNVSTSSPSSVVVGSNNSLTNSSLYSIGIGRNIQIDSSDSIAIGSHISLTNSSRSFAVRGNISNSQNSATILGSVTNSNDSIAIGNYSQVAGGLNSMAIGGGAGAFAQSSTCVGGYARAYGIGSIALGVSSRIENSGAYSVAIGEGASVSGAYSVAIGEGASVSGAYSVAIGEDASVSDDYSIAIGYLANASKSNNIAVSLKYANKDWSGSMGLKIANGATAWSSDSDERIKDNIELANTTLCLNNIRELPVKRYSFKDFAADYCDEHQVGFIAQDLEKFYPKLVHHESCREFDDPKHPGEKIKIDGFRSIEKEPLIPVLWGGIQELAKRLEAAEKKIAELEKNK